MGRGQVATISACYACGRGGVAVCSLHGSASSLPDSGHVSKAFVNSRCWGRLCHSVLVCRSSSLGFECHCGAGRSEVGPEPCEDVIIVIVNILPHRRPLP
eukprot:9268966-Pyramimonas_sp.AAC.1